MTADTFDEDRERYPAPLNCSATWRSLCTSSPTTAKPRPISPGARRFDGGIQSQQVGLVGDFLDDLADVADLGDRLVQVGNGATRGLHRLDEVSRRRRADRGRSQCADSRAPWTPERYM